MTMTTCPLCETRRPYPQWGRPTETAIHLIGIATVIILISKTIIISLMGITPTMLTFEDVKLYYNPNPIERNSSYSPLRYVFYPSKFGAFYVYFQPVSPARTA